MELSKAIFWDTGYNSIDWEKNARYVIARVIMFGTIEDWRTIQSYYGMDRIKEEMLQARDLDPKSLSFPKLYIQNSQEEFQMLHTNTVQPRTLGLLRQIMDLPDLKSYALSGGTSLALQIGHRMSVDLDFFGSEGIDKEYIISLMKHLGTVRPMSQTKSILILDINDIKVDFVTYSYPLLFPILEKEGIRVFSQQDIAAMKLAAIVGRGTKRDFIDLHFLLKKFTLKQLVSFYNAKYNDSSELMVVRSLTYFDDAELETSPKMIIPSSWTSVKKNIKQKVSELYS